MAVQPLCALRVAESTVAPSAVSCTSTDSGRLPSRSPSSSHTFVTLTEVSSGSCMLVMVQPPLASPDLEARYPSGTPASSTS